MAKRIAVLLRVSTDQQKFEAQKNSINEYLQNIKEPVAHVKHFTEKITGKLKKRPVFDDLMDQCRQGKFDTVVCYKLDRLGRNAKHIMLSVLQLSELGIDCVFTNDRDRVFNLTDDNPMAPAMLGFFAALAQIERENIVERTKDGLEAARRAGKKLGRRSSITDEQMEKIQQCLRHNWAVSKISKHLGIPERTVYRVRKKIDEKAGLSA